MAEDVFKKIVSHCKEYGFVFPSSEIYDGLGAVYDYAQNGVEMKNNIKQVNGSPSRQYRRYRLKHFHAPNNLEGIRTR